MIRPEPADDALLSDVRDAEPPTGTLCVWWLGQSGYILKGAGRVVVIDPYLSDSLEAKYTGTDKPHVRLTRSPLRPDALTFADVVLSTHKHSDHMDPATLPALLGASPDASLVLPASLVEHAAAFGVSRGRMKPIDADGLLDVAGVTVRAVPAAHETVGRDAEGRCVFLGYVITLNGVTVYHAGDTIPYAGLVERVRPLRPDVAILPINGRDARRVALATPGNCSVDEALCLAEMLEAKVLVPCHYDMFAFNTADVRAFEARAAEAWPKIDIRVLRPGRRAILP